MSDKARFNKTSRPRVTEKSHADAVRLSRPVDPQQALAFSQLLQQKSTFERSQVLARETEASEDKSRARQLQPTEPRSIPAAFLATGARYFQQSQQEQTVGLANSSVVFNEHQQARVEIEANTSSSQASLKVQEACEAIISDVKSQNTTLKNRIWKVALTHGDSVHIQLQVECTASNGWVVRISPDLEQGPSPQPSVSESSDADAFVADLSALCLELEHRLNTALASGVGKVVGKT